MVGMRRRVGVLFASMLMAAFAMPLPARAATIGTGDWPMFIDGPAHNGNNRAETVLSPSTVSGLVVTHTYSSWVAEGNEDAGAYPVTSGSLGASFSNGTTGDHLILDVFNLPAGTLRWHRIVAELGGDTTPAVPEPAFSGGDIFAGAGSTISAYDATSGHLLWSRAGAAGDHFNAITVSNGVIYADEYGSTTAVYALNATSGAVVWSMDSGGN
jgi:outer membrane protein assembly factor BamB